MKLVLRVTSQAGDEINSITLQQEAATIGRNAGNTLVLEDSQRYISGHHAFIDFRESNYFVTDASTNGVLINNAQQAIGSGNSVKLRDGDQLHIGQYTIFVSLMDAPPDILQEPLASKGSQLLNNSFADLSDSPDLPFGDQVDDPFGMPDIASIDIENKAEAESEDDMFADDWFTPKSNSQSTPVKELITDDFFAEQEDETGPVVKIKPSTAGAKPSVDVVTVATDIIEDPFPDDFFSTEQPSDVVDTTQLDKPEETMLDKLVDQDQAIQEQVDLPVAASECTTLPNGISSPDIQVKPLASPEYKQLAESADAHALIDSFLRGAGLENAGINDALTPEKFFIIGNILRASVQGTMDVLSGRAKIKNEMHMDVTMIRAVQNNPVKFSVGAEEAIRKMLAPQDKGYLPAEEAIEEVFDDIRAHQFSVIAGMKTALLEVLKRFDPEKLEQRLQQQSPIAASIPIHKQAKLWRLFATLYDDIESEATDNFYHLFGQAFAESYEEQIIKLKNSKRNTRL